MTQATPTLTGQDIAEAQGAMRTLIDEVLAGADVTSTEYVVLRVLAVRGPYENPAVLHEFLAGQRQLDLTEPEAATLVDGLAARGLATSPSSGGAGPARITPAGEALLGRLTAEAIMPANVRLYADLDAADLATAHHVLTELVRRANRISEELRTERDRTR
jgi:DNA-binding MarR family transcriptional regulator